jgi:tetrahydromethanopterin S-methyltransferase subunit C
MEGEGEYCTGVAVIGADVIGADAGRLVVGPGVETHVPMQSSRVIGFGRKLSSLY